MKSINSPAQILAMQAGLAPLCQYAPVGLLLLLASSEVPPTVLVLFDLLIHLLLRELVGQSQTSASRQLPGSRLLVYHLKGARCAKVIFFLLLAAPPTAPFCCRSLLPFLLCPGLVFGLCPVGLRGPSLPPYPSDVASALLPVDRLLASTVFVLSPMSLRPWNASPPLAWLGSLPLT